MFYLHCFQSVPKMIFSLKFTANLLNFTWNLLQCLRRQEVHTLSKDEAISIEGTIVDTMPSAFKVELVNGMVVRATLAGKMRMNHIRVLPGDRVTVELSPYDLTTGRIVYRFK